MQQPDQKTIRLTFTQIPQVYNIRGNTHAQRKLMEEMPQVHLKDGTFRNLKAAAYKTYVLTYVLYDNY